MKRTKNRSEASKPPPFIPKAGMFCLTRITIPPIVDTAAYTQVTSLLSDGKTTKKKSAVHTRVCYIHSVVKVASQTYNVHFCSGFNNRPIITQSFDDPEKRDRFLPIHPTQPLSADKPAPLRILKNGVEQDWDLPPAYICLWPPVAVEQSLLHSVTAPSPELSPSERQRLDGLIAAAEARFGNDNNASESSSESSASESSAPEASDSVERNSNQQFDTSLHSSNGGPEGDTSKDTTRSWRDVLMSPNSSTPRHRNYATDKGISGWQEDMCGMERKSDDSDAYSDYSVEGEPHPMFMPKPHAIKIYTVSFEPLPADVDQSYLDEIDPAYNFKLEAKEHHAYTLLGVN